MYSAEDVNSVWAAIMLASSKTVFPPYSTWQRRLSISMNVDNKAQGLGTMENGVAIRSGPDVDPRGFSTVTLKAWVGTLGEEGALLLHTRLPESIKGVTCHEADMKKSNMNRQKEMRSLATPWSH